MFNPRLLGYLPIHSTRGGGGSEEKAQRWTGGQKLKEPIPRADEI